MNTDSEAPLPAASTSPPSHEPRASSLRETIETVVFVVVLVLLLKTFVAEAFVIPTGSMATTLWGDQKIVTCPQCALEFPVNCSTERDNWERSGERETVEGCTCPNCRYRIDFRQDSVQTYCRTGDRVVVAKYLYDLVAPPEREDVVVFKYPMKPQNNWTALNYIKRLVGLPGETIGIYYGNLYVCPGDGTGENSPYPNEPRPEDPQELWLHAYMYERKAEDLFHQGKFQIVRKPPAQVLALRRIVFDNDRQPRDLNAAHFAPRWAPEREEDNSPALDFRAARQRGQHQAAWSDADNNAFVHSARAGELAWLRYRHLVVDPPRDRSTDLRSLHAVKPSLITDFLGYNTQQTHGGWNGFDQPQNWVGDLLLECDVQLDSPGSSADPQLVFELTRGVDQFQARWDVSTGECSLVRIKDKREEVLAAKPTGLKRKGSYAVRFANVDERLLVWLDGALLFGDGIPYSAVGRRGPTENDLRPASIAARGAGVSVRRLRLWRDSYYTAHSHSRSDGLPNPNDWTDPSCWNPLYNLPVNTYYVQPGHYLCLGDNSPQSADSRSWGLVPQRLMLGRALLVYFPLTRIQAIR